jgi:hypothetical protein
MAESAEQEFEIDPNSSFFEANMKNYNQRDYVFLREKVIFIFLNLV